MFEMCLKDPIVLRTRCRCSKVRLVMEERRERTPHADFRAGAAATQGVFQRGKNARRRNRQCERHETPLPPPFENFGAEPIGFRDVTSDHRAGEAVTDQTALYSRPGIIVI